MKMTTRAFCRSIAAALLIAVAAANSSAAILANWTFETATPADVTATSIGPIAADSGTGAMLGVHATTTAWTTPAGNGSANSVSGNTWAVGDYYQFSATTQPNNSIFTLQWDHTSSGTGPRDFSVAYSLDGSTYTPITSYAVLANASPNPVWNSATSSPIYTNSATISNVTAPTIFFRLTNSTTVSANGGTVAAGGTSRVDNISIIGVPEPTTCGLAVVGLIGTTLIRRRRA